MNQIVDARIEERTQVRKSPYCHQCRQKRSDVVGTCVTKRRNTTCAVRFCPSCLWNRYGMIAKEVASKDDWLCYKCRGICNCSMCMKQKGKLTAKEDGCSNEQQEDAVGVESSAEENHAAVKTAKRRLHLNDSSAGYSEENAAAEKRTKPVPKEKKVYELKEVKLPQGIESITVSGIDLPPENAGSVLQFLEFCSTFGKALGLREGQAQCIVREIISGRSTRSQEHSTLTQMIIQLLTLILVDGGETSVDLSASDDKWFIVLGECLAESEVKLDDDFLPKMFQTGIAEYEKMNSSQKLKLLNFLCDEALGTAMLRNCIENPESVKKIKKAKENLNAAKAKEKQLDQKIKNELARTEAENNGVELTIGQRLAILSQVNAESENVCEEMYNALEMLRKNSQEYDEVLRNCPVELDDNGRILRRLNSYIEEPKVLLQDLGSWSDECPHEKWFAFSSEQKPEVEKFIAFKKKKRLIEKKKGKTVLES